MERIELIPPTSFRAATPEVVSDPVNLATRRWNLVGIVEDDEDGAFDGAVEVDMELDVAGDGSWITFYAGGTSWDGGAGPVSVHFSEDLAKGPLPEARFVARAVAAQPPTQGRFSLVLLIESDLGG